MLMGTAGGNAFSLWWFNNPNYTSSLHEFLCNFDGSLCCTLEFAVSWTWSNVTCVAKSLVSDVVLRLSSFSISIWQVSCFSNTLVSEWTTCRGLMPFTALGGATLPSFSAIPGKHYSLSLWAVCRTPNLALTAYEHLSQGRVHTPQRVTFYRTIIYFRFVLACNHDWDILSS